MYRTLLLLAVVCFPVLGQEPNPDGSNRGLSAQTEYEISISESEMALTLSQIRAIIDYYSRQVAAQQYPDDQQQAANRIALHDLNEQIRMASATIHLKWATWVGVLFALIGLVMIGGTLYFTRKASDDTRQMLKIADRTLQQNRAFMTPGEVVGGLRVNDKKDVVGVQIHSRWINCGDSPAINVRTFTAHAVETTEAQFKPFDEGEKLAAQAKHNLGKNKFWGGYCDLSRNLAINIADNKQILIVYNIVEYSDIYGTRYRNEWTSRVRIHFLPPEKIEDGNREFPIRWEAFGAQQGEKIIGRDESATYGS